MRDGTLPLGRLDFMLPLAAISLLTALAAAFTPGLSVWLRRPAQLSALIGAFSVLPEYPFILSAHADPELRPTLILGALALVGVVLLIMVEVALSRLEGGEESRASSKARPFAAAPLRVTNEAGVMLSGRPLGAAYCLLSLVALAFAVRALVVVWPALAAVFDAQPRLNWGPVVLGMGAGMILVAAVRALREM